MTIYIPIGISGSGKSSYQKKFLPKVNVICPDTIRKQLTGDVSNQSMNTEVWIVAYDQLESYVIKGEDVYLPKYDMSGTAKRYDNYTLVKPSRIIISEGLFALTEKIVDAFDFKIYVDVSTHVQKERFYIRAAERDLGDSTEEVYLNASRKAQIYVHPTMKKADIILSGEAKRENYKRFINNLISLICDVNGI